MRKIGYAGYPFPPRVIHQAIWLYLWTVPAVQGLLRQFGQRSAVAIYSVFGATSLPTLIRYADWRPINLGGLWSPIEPAGLASSGPTGSPSCVRLPSQPKPIDAERSGGPSIGLLCRHDPPCDSSCLVCQGDGGDVEMPPAQKPGEPSVFHLTAPHAS